MVNHSLLQISSLNLFTSGRSLTPCQLQSLARFLLQIWPNLLCHNFASSSLVSKHSSLFCSSNTYKLLEFLFSLSFCFSISMLWITDFILSLQTAFSAIIIGLSRFYLSTTWFFNEGKIVMQFLAMCPKVWHL